MYLSGNVRIYTNKVRSEDWGPVLNFPHNIYLLFFFFSWKRKKKEFCFFLCLIKNRSSVLSPHFVCIDRKYFFSFQINKSQFILVTKLSLLQLINIFPIYTKEWGLRTEDLFLIKHRKMKFLFFSRKKKSKYYEGSPKQVLSPHSSLLTLFV